MKYCITELKYAEMHIVALLQWPISSQLFMMYLGTSYGVYSVSSKTGLCSILVNAVPYTVLYQIGPLYQWLSARLQYLHCIGNGDTAVLH